MGLFGDLFGSSSHSQSTTSTSQVTNTQLAGGAIQAPVNYGSGRQTVNVTSIDPGAIQLASDIGSAALDLGRSEAAAGSAVAIAGLAHASDAYTSSLYFAGGVTHDALTGTTSVAHDAIANASDNLNTSLQAVIPYAGKALDSVTKFASSALDSNTYIAGKALDSEAMAFNNSLGQVNALAQQVSQSSLQTTDATVQKIITTLVVAAAFVFAAPYVFGKGR